jgi:hypothetical protein
MAPPGEIKLPKIERVPSAERNNPEHHAAVNRSSPTGPAPGLAYERSGSVAID